MIEIDIFRFEDGRISGFRVRGHSGTERRGRDIVCAGVSALAQAALLGIGEQLHRDAFYSIDPSGDLRVKLKGEPDDLTEAVLGTMRLGFARIEEANPSAVRMRESGGESS